MNFKRNEIYFFPIPEKDTIVGFVVVIADFFLCIMSLSGIFLHGVLLRFVAAFSFLGIVALGIFLMRSVKKFNENREFMTSIELDDICTTHLGDIKMRALKKLGLDEDQITEADPISLHGYSFDRNDVGAVPFHVALGDDGRPRSSIYCGTIYLFTPESVYCYKIGFSLLTQAFKETTDEFFYQDIVSVSTESKTEQFGEGEEKITFSYEEFVLTTSGGNKMRATISDKDGAERSVRSMRSLLREKKQAV